MLEPERPHYDRPAVCVIAQQYSSSSIVSVTSQQRKEKFRLTFKKVIISILVVFLKLRVCSCV